MNPKETKGDAWGALLDLLVSLEGLPIKFEGSVGMSMRRGYEVVERIHSRSSPGQRLCEECGYPMKSHDDPEGPEPVCPSDVGIEREAPGQEDGGGE